MADRASTSRLPRRPQVIKRRKFITLLSGAAAWPVISAGPALPADGSHEFTAGTPEQPYGLPGVSPRLFVIHESTLRRKLTPQEFIAIATSDAAVLATYLRNTLALQQPHELDRLLVETIADILDGNKVVQTGRRLHLTHQQTPELEPTSQSS